MGIINWFYLQLWNSLDHGFDFRRNRSCKRFGISFLPPGFLFKLCQLIGLILAHENSYEGFPKILETCGQWIMEKVSLLKQIPCDWLQPQFESSHSQEELSYARLMSSLTTLQNHIFICDTGISFYWIMTIYLSYELIWWVVYCSYFISCVSLVGQRILKVDGDSGVFSNLQFSNFGILGLPYWLSSPLERVYAV